MRCRVCSRKSDFGVIGRGTGRRRSTIGVSSVLSEQPMPEPDARCETSAADVGHSPDKPRCTMWACDKSSSCRVLVQRPGRGRNDTHIAAVHLRVCGRGRIGVRLERNATERLQASS